MAAKKVAVPTPTKKPVVVRRRPAGETAHDQSLEGIQNDPRLQAYVPDSSVAKRYIPRQIHGVWDADIASRARATDQNILIEGDTGAGKTLFGEAYAARYGLYYYSLPCDVSIDPSAFFGKMVPTEEAGKFRWQDGPVTQVVRNGGLLNISEGNFMPPKIAASIYPLLDGRRYIPLLGHHGEIVRAHRAPKKVGDELVKQCWCDLSEAECRRRLLLVVMDLNPQYRGTQELNAAFRNRFAFKLKWGYSEEVEKKLVQSPTLRQIAKDIREMSQEVRTPVSTNMMMEFMEFAVDPRLGLDFAIANFAASFSTAEANAVVKVFDLNKTKISTDVAFVVSAMNNSDDDSDDNLEEIEMEFGEL